MNHLQICEHPVYYVNPYTGVPGYASCGKCIACKSQHNTHWVERLERERRCWSYTIFFTLTYANRYQSKLYFDERTGCLASPGRIVRKQDTTGKDIEEYQSSGECISAEQLELLNLSDNDKDYLLRRRNFDYVETSDLQKFIKRFRYYAYKQATEAKQNPSVRYFISTEVGPTTLRSHIHGLLFFNSETLYKHLDETFYKSWRLSEYPVDWSPVTGSATSYTAAYCNSIQGLPEFYKIRPLRPFVLCSKAPAIGTIDPPGEEISPSEIIDHLTTSFSIKRKSSKELVSIPLWREIYTKYFPRITGFSRVDDYTRTVLYGLSSQFSFWTFKDFFQWFNKTIDTDNIKVENTYLHDNLYLDPTSKECLDYASTRFLHRSLHAVLDKLCINVDSLKRIWYVSKRVFVLCSKFGYNLVDYVSKIKEFYSKMDYQRLKGYFQFQDEYFRTSENPSSWIAMDSMFLRTCSIHRESSVAFPKWIDYTLRSFNINPLKFFKDDDYFHKITYSKESVAYFKSLYDAYSDSDKNKQKKEYLSKHPELTYLTFNNSEKFIYHGY